MEPVQILMFIVAYGYLFARGYAPKYICMYMLPFQSMSLMYLPVVTSQLIAVQLSFLLFCIISFNEFLNTLKPKLLGIIAWLFVPFVVSYIYNTFYFTPVRSVEEGLREVTKTSLTTFNLSQLAYVIFSYALLLVFAGVKVEIEKLKKIMDLSIYTVVFIALFQLASHYGGFNVVYKFFFYNLELGMVNQVMQSGVKRINACFIEPSYFGFYGSFTLFFYLNCFGYKEFKRSRAVQLLFICGLLSTTTTFYLGMVILLVIMYLYYTPVEEKIFLYVIGIILSPLLFTYGYDQVMDYIGSKQSSTNHRSYISNMGIEAFWASPLFGTAYGTVKSFQIHSQMLGAVGLFGVLCIIIAFLKLATTRATKLYLLCFVLLGYGNFEYVRPEFWLYLGLLSNPYVSYQVLLMYGGKSGKAQPSG